MRPPSFRWRRSSRCSPSAGRSRSFARAGCSTPHTCREGQAVRRVALRRRTACPSRQRGRSTR
jgi:hypothetical protein